MSRVRGRSGDGVTRLPVRPYRSGRQGSLGCSGHRVKTTLVRVSVLEEDGNLRRSSTNGGRWVRQRQRQEDPGRVEGEEGEIGAGEESGDVRTWVRVPGGTIRHPRRTPLFSSDKTREETQS